MWHMLHWINDHWTVLSDIGLTWVVPVLFVFMAGRLFRSEYRSGDADVTLAALRMDEDRTEEKKKQRFAA